MGEDNDHDASSSACNIQIEGSTNNNDIRNVDVTMNDDSLVTSAATTTAATATSEDVNLLNNSQVKNEAVVLTASSDKKVDTTTTPLRSNDFVTNSSNSNRKVLIQGVMKFNDVKYMKRIIDQWFIEIKKLQDQQQQEKGPQCDGNTNNNELLQYDKIKKPPKETWMVLTMKHENMVQPLTDYINNNNICNKRGNKLYAKVVMENDDDDATGNKRKSSQDNNSNKRQKSTDNGASARRPVTMNEIKNQITPLWNLSSEQQLNFKMRDMIIKKCTIKIIQELKQKFR